MAKSLNIDPRKVSLSERDIEDWLWENPEVIGGYSPITQWIGRQYKLPSGIADLIGIDSRDVVVVVEVKNVEINKAAILQVCRYAFDIKLIAGRRMDYPSRDPGSVLQEPYVRQVIVGPSIDDQTFYEAVACDVQIVTFAASMDLSLRQLEWVEDYRKDRNAEYDRIARNAEWGRYGEHVDDHIERSMSQVRDGGDS